MKAVFFPRNYRLLTTEAPFCLVCGCHFCGTSSGCVSRGQFIDCVAIFAPDASTTMQSLQAVCEVQGSKICKLLLKGTCRVPKVLFSFTAYDFGSLLVPAAIDASYDTQAAAPRISSRAILKVTNTDPHHECSISSPFSSTAVFDFQPMQVSLSPEEALEVPIIFSPREAKLYKAKIPFFVNDRPAANVQLSGRGVPIRCKAVVPG